MNYNTFNYNGVLQLDYTGKNKMYKNLYAPVLNGSDPKEIIDVTNVDIKEESFASDMPNAVKLTKLILYNIPMMKKSKLNYYRVIQTCYREMNKDKLVPYILVLNMNAGTDISINGDKMNITFDISENDNIFLIIPHNTMCIFTNISFITNLYKKNISMNDTNLGMVFNLVINQSGINKKTISTYSNDTNSKYANINDLLGINYSKCLMIYNNKIQIHKNVLQKLFFDSIQSDSYVKKSIYSLITHMNNNIIFDNTIKSSWREILFDVNTIDNYASQNDYEDSSVSFSKLWANTDTRKNITFLTFTNFTTNNLFFKNLNKLEQMSDYEIYKPSKLHDYYNKSKSYTKTVLENSRLCSHKSSENINYNLFNPSIMNISSFYIFLKWFWILKKDYIEAVLAKVSDISEKLYIAKITKKDLLMLDDIEYINLCGQLMYNNITNKKNTHNIIDLKVKIKLDPDWITQSYPPKL